VPTEWQWTFARADGSSTDITLPATFVVERAAEGTPIVCYINHTDIAAIMRERGLLPAAGN
jgi:beta-galactosidase/beta-glucuronidase